MSVALAGLMLGLFNIFRPLYTGRYSLKIDVSWDYSTPEPDDNPAPNITIRNTGGRTAYVSEIFLVEANGLRHLIGDLGSRKVDAHDKIEHRPDWSEPRDHESKFRYDWRALHVLVQDAGGGEWQSAPPVQKPSWFVITPPFIRRETN